MADHPGSYRICATCVFWVGSRDADLYGSRVKDCASEGRCAVHCGPYRNSKRPANGCGCNAYQKWPVLR